MTKRAYLVAIVGVFVSVHVLADDSGKTKNLYCPVMPEETVDPTIFIRHHGEDVYFCCQRCKKMFIENPAKYVTKLAQVVKVENENHAHEHEADQHSEEPYSGLATETSLAETSHDHATDHGESSALTRGIRFLGKFHPLMVHFPIGLILAAALAEALFMLTGWKSLSEAAYFSILLGALGAIAAVALGLAAGNFAQYPSPLDSTLTTHRWLGIATGVTAVLAGILSTLSHRNVPNLRIVRAYRATLLLGAVLVSITGHFGALLIYGLEHFKW